jgi:hypothetical protein
MDDSVKRRWMSVAISSAMVLAGCGSHREQGPPQASERAAPSPASATQPATAPATAQASVTWSLADKGIAKLQYPADWQAKKNPDYELMLVPAGARSDERRITLDVPDLPPHLPFMLQMGRIQKDYVADLKKDHPDLQVEDAVDQQLPNSTARLIRSGWNQAGMEHRDVALLIIHDSAVYILDAQTDQPHLAVTRAAFDAIRGSLQWTR